MHPALYSGWIMSPCPAEYTMHEYTAFSDSNSRKDSRDASDSVEASPLLMENRSMHQQMIRHVRSTIVRRAPNSLNNHQPPQVHASSNCVSPERPSAITRKASPTRVDPDQNIPESSTIDSISVEVIERAIRQQSGAAGRIHLFWAAQFLGECNAHMHKWDRSQSRDLQYLGVTGMLP